ncbi:MAG: hypothetical protein CR997_12590 [Acidobacteria bacterium]|nr:MAG: hypothetical protein CR997_12590 [Acidobacteriota bacterium]
MAAKGNRILGSQVGAQTEEGLRHIDQLVEKPSGETVAIEVKSGWAKRTAKQEAKDNAMAAKGAKLVGKNAPDALKGKTRKIKTEVYRVNVGITGGKK